MKNLGTCFLSGNSVWA